jgi:hypothetical protein
MKTLTGGTLGQERKRRAMRWRGLSAPFLAVILAGLLTVPHSASAAQQGCPNGRIAFDSVRNGKRSIYAIDPINLVDPSLPAPTPVRLTLGDADAKPAWAPPRVNPSVGCFGHPSHPGTFIAFQRTVGGSTDIYRLDVGEPGSPVTSLTPETEDDPSNPANNPARLLISDAAAPAWKPGRFGSEHPTAIAFERKTVAGKRDIFVANYDGSQVTGVTNLTATPDVDEANPDWSIGDQPFSGDLAFDSDSGGRREIWVMDPSYDASTQQWMPGEKRRVTDGPGGSSANPSWFSFYHFGPSLAESIVFAGPDRDGGNSHIHFQWVIPGYWPLESIRSIEEWTLERRAFDVSDGLSEGRPGRGLGYLCDRSLRGRAVPKRDAVRGRRRQPGLGGPLPKDR